MARVIQGTVLDQNYLHLLSDVASQVALVVKNLPANAGDV